MPASHFRHSRTDAHGTHRCVVPLSICLLLSGWLVLGGCARSKYRRAADREAYCLIDSRQSDPRWDLPGRKVEPRAHSRMYLANEVDCGAKPPDDPAAHRYMVQPDCKKVAYYNEIPTRRNVENPVWLDYLPRNAEGEVDLTQPLAIDLALLHSREYQTEYESIYLSALNLSGNRFEFDTQWFGGGGTLFTATGKDLGNNRILRLSDRLGFGKNLAGGGQFATEMLNSLSWNFGSGGVQSGSATIISTFTQPLLRGAFRHVRLENLTQAERNLLYQVRDFARFRRTFYVDITERYLGLLTQKQAIVNTRTNVENLYQNLLEHRFYQDLKIVSQIQVDQVFQQYQSGRRLLLTSEQALITSEDNLKFALGLPAWLQFEIDESLLEPFDLVDPTVVQLQNDAQELFEELVQFLPPLRASPEKLKSYFERYQQLRSRVADLLPGVKGDLQRWKQRLEDTDRSQLTDDDVQDLTQQDVQAAQVERALNDLTVGLADRNTYDEGVYKKLIDYETNPPSDDDKTEEKSLEDILKQFDSLDDVTIDDILPDELDDTAVTAWSALEEAIGRKLREEIAEIYVAQTQVKLFLIDIERLTLPSETAITFAHQNRLDLMNSKAIVMDSFRRVEVAADALESDLDVTGQAIVGSDPNSNKPYQFDSASNRYTIGLQFDGPLNRRNERNAYRASQIAYQRASRNFIANKDSIANEVRLILRRLELSRLNFQIARQQVVAAARQVDQAQIDLRQSTEADSNLTIVLLGALDGMLDAKNSLILNWVNYRVQKMRLFAALEMLYLDERGVWINEDTGLDALQQFRAIDPEYFPPQLVEPLPQGEFPELLPPDNALIESEIEDLPAP